ncbi:hypothetical protein EZV62_016751 [Acer yangbiense]|uniref:Uncharacterized protein n=1 Tax=Acer yangbiense TaxID=1000413 RepID=A0A5C7HRS8_9ROSI|nr:hypothetical protein EZV62_016751 [Acer yangbiense]
MAQFPAYPPPPPNPVSIVGPQYCAPYPVDLAIVRKVMTITDGNFVVQDINGNVLFKLKGALMSIHDRHVLLDAAGKPLVTLRQKLKTKLDVFLANNTKEEVCDFKVKGSWFERSCVFYAGESDTVVAQMHKKHSVQSILIGKDKFMVTVFPNIDYAFIIALIVILDAINKEDSGSGSIDMSIISPQFCVPQPLDLVIRKQVLNITSGNFDVNDTNGNLVLRVKGLLFPGRRLKTELDVYLANNITVYVSDFKVKGSWLEQSCTVYAGESNTIYAQMYKKHGIRSILIGKDKFMVTVYPNVNYAFIVALIVILDGITG